MDLDLIVKKEEELSKEFDCLAAELKNLTEKEAQIKKRMIELSGGWKTLETMKIELTQSAKLEEKKEENK